MILSIFQWKINLYSWIINRNILWNFQFYILSFYTFLFTSFFLLTSLFIIIMPRKANLIKKICSEVFNSFNFQYLAVLLIELVQTIMILAITLPIGSILRRNLLSVFYTYISLFLDPFTLCWVESSLHGCVYWLDCSYAFYSPCASWLPCLDNVYKIQSAYGVYWDGRVYLMS